MEYSNTIVYRVTCYEYFNSHAYGLKFKDIAVVMDFLHLFAASLWVGGLSSIILLLRNEDNKWHMYWDMIKRFSPWATGAVIVILIIYF